ncbi:MAG: glycosyltransferase family 4 protein [Candidatus Altiarchaeota archaeon]
MKLCVLTDFNFPHVKGGGEVRIHEIARRLVKDGVDVTILSMRLRGVEDAEEVDGVRVVHIGPRVRNPPKRNVIQFAHYMLSALYYLLKNSFDAIEANTYVPLIPAFIATRFRDVPLFATVHDVYRNEWSGQYPGWLAGIVEWILLKIPYDRILTVSLSTRNILVHEYGVSEDKINIVPNGVDLSYVDSLNVKAPVKKSIIFVGRLISHKHVDDLIRAFGMIIPEFPGVTLKVVGSGAERRKLEAMTSHMGLEDNVSFMGVLDNDDVIREIKNSTLLVLPSTREGFGIVLAEAGACGKPVVAYKSGGVVEVVEEGVNGFLVEPRDVDALAGRIKELLSDDRLSREMGSAGRSRVEQYFTWDIAASKVLILLKKQLQ